MKTNISLACKKSPFFPPVKMVLGQLPSTLTLTLKLSQTLALTGGGGFSLGGILPTPVKTKEMKKRKEIKNNRREKKLIKQKRLSFIKFKETFPKTRPLKSSSCDNNDGDQNPYR